MIATKLFRAGVLGVCLLSLASCASTSVMPLSADTIQITAQADPDCGPAGAQQAALKRAAVETIRRGFDSFIIVSVSAANNVRVVGQTPIVANTNATAIDGRNGNTTFVNTNTTYSGGQPILGGSFDQNLTVQMFRATDPGVDRAISARATLGPNWQKAVAAKTDDFC